MKLTVEQKRALVDYCICINCKGAFEDLDVFQDVDNNNYVEYRDAAEDFICDIYKKAMDELNKESLNECQ